MKHFYAAACLFLWSASVVAPSQAQGTTDIPTSQCAPRALNISSIGGDGWVTVEWTQPAVSPNPSKKMELGGYGENLDLVCPTFTASFSDSLGQYEFKGKSFKDLVDFSGMNVYDTESSIDFIDDSSLDSRYIGLVYNKSNNKFSLSLENADSFAKYNISYRVDGKILLPLYLNGKTYSLNIPKATKYFEIYTTAGEYTAWEYLKVDLGNSRLTLKSENPFPSK